MGARWQAWKRQHWDPKHNVGFHSDGFVFSLGQTVYPPLRRAARWFWAQWCDHPAAWITAACALIGAIVLVFR